MSTLKTHIPASWTNEGDASSQQHVNLLDRFGAFADSQNEKRALWFFVALAVQGVFFLPLPVFLMYYYNASFVVLLITMTCFFTTIIAYMGGAGIRMVLLLSALSILIQVIMSIVVMV